MANRYWVTGGTGAWGSTTNWSASSGGAAGASVPTSTDNVFFDANSGTGAITSLSTMNCADLTVTVNRFFNAGTFTFNIYGNMSLFTGGNPFFWISTGTVNFAATTPVTLASNGQTIYSAVIFNGVGGVFQLQDDMTVNQGTVTTTLTAGTLDLNNRTLQCRAFFSNNSNTRSIAFGTTGNITVIGQTAGGTIFNLGTVTGFTATGTSAINITYAGTTASSVSVGLLSEANALSFNFTQGLYSLTFLNGTNSAKNVDFTGFTGTWTARGTSIIYGNLTLAAGMTIAASVSVLTFGATSGTQIITSNGKTIDEPITIDGAGGTVRLADALTLGATRILTLTNGNFDGNSKTISGASSISVSGSVIAKNISTALAFTLTSGTLTQGAANTVGACTLTGATLDLAGYTLSTTSFATGVGTKSITFNGGTIAVSAATTTAFNNANPSGFTTTTGTGVGKISMTAATAKTFVGGGSTYNCTLSNDGAGALTITGANTFTTIANGVQPTSFVFPSATTTTISNWNVVGAAGSLVTITASTAGTPAILSTAAGFAVGNYLSVKDSTGTGVSAWYAGSASTNVSGNSGWSFVSPGNGFFGE